LNRLDYEPEEKNIPSYDEIRVSAGQQHIASAPCVKRKYAHFEKIFARLSAVALPKADQHENMHNFQLFSPPHPVPAAGGGRQQTGPFDPARETLPRAP
jgi:hypothetical protein